MSATQLEITLAIAPGCPHCPNVLQALGEMVKRGDIAAMRVINIAVEQEFTERHHIRSVPWLKIGPFILTGAHSQSEIKQWVEQANSEEGIRNYISSKLTDGELDTVTGMVQQSPDALLHFIPLIEDDKTNINVRLGIGAILEELAGQEILYALLPELLKLLKHSQARVRGDAAHFLSLLHNKTAIEALQQLHDDPDTEVREIAAESIESLEALDPE